MEQISWLKKLKSHNYVIGFLINFYQKKNGDIIYIYIKNYIATT